VFKMNKFLTDASHRVDVHSQDLLQAGHVDLLGHAA
jgi:hypothetical protein